MGNPKDTLLATLLSARTRDAQVVKVYPGFLKKFPTLTSLAKADVREIMKPISTIGLYKNKARAIKALAIRIINVYDGHVPSTMEELVTLPGVGRKTASCVMWYGFGKAAMAVDVHVFRIAHRLGWAKGKNPEIVERELMALIPEKYWGEVNRAFVQFGRDVCRPGKPQCWRCPVAEQCPFQPKTKEPKR